MDHVFDNLLDSRLNYNIVTSKPKIISIIAENFSLVEDQARFLKATLAIPAVTNLPYSNSNLRLIQIGPLHQEVGDQVRKLRWAVNQYEDFGESICDRIEEDLHEIGRRNLIFINDLSRVELGSADPNEAKKLLKLAYRLKQQSKAHIVFLYQHSSPKSSSTLLRDLEYISDCSVRAKSCKAGYFTSIWWQPTHEDRRILTLLPAKVKTAYYISKIGKNYFSKDLLCFYEKTEVSKTFDLSKESQSKENNDKINSAEDKDIDSCRKSKVDFYEEETRRKLEVSKLGDDLDEKYEKSTRPYTQAQNPEQSRIFYYPEKEDDIDEDDPDNDLGF